MYYQGADYTGAEPLYGYHDISGHNPYNQSRAVGSAPSVMAAHVWHAGAFYWAPAIPARLQWPLQDNDITAYAAPPIPHAVNVSGLAQSAPRNNNQSDIPYLSLKAPNITCG